MKHDQFSNSRSLVISIESKSKSYVNLSTLDSILINFSAVKWGASFWMKKSKLFLNLFIKAFCHCAEFYFSDQLLDWFYFLNLLFKICRIILFFSNLNFDWHHLYHNHFLKCKHSLTLIFFDKVLISLERNLKAPRSFSDCYISDHKTLF